jgi:hypothetical protein
MPAGNDDGSCCDGDSVLDGVVEDIEEFEVGSGVEIIVVNLIGCK